MNELVNGWGRSTCTSRDDYKYKEVENIMLVFKMTFLFRRRQKCTDIFSCPLLS